MNCFWVIRIYENGAGVSRIIDTSDFSICFRKKLAKIVYMRPLKIMLPPRAVHFSFRKIYNARFRDMIFKLRKGLYM